MWPCWGTLFFGFAFKSHNMSFWSVYLAVRTYPLKDTPDNKTTSVNFDWPKFCNFRMGRTTWKFFGFTLVIWQRVCVKRLIHSDIQSLKKQKYWNVEHFLGAQILPEPFRIKHFQTKLLRNMYSMISSHFPSSRQPPHWIQPIQHLSHHEKVFFLSKPLGVPFPGPRNVKNYLHTSSNTTDHISSPT